MTALASVPAGVGGWRVFTQRDFSRSTAICWRLVLAPLCSITTTTPWKPPASCVPASLAKGLEFDAVIVAEPARIVASEPRGTHRLYVVLTRAVSTLHAQPLPNVLR